MKFKFCNFELPFNLNLWSYNKLMSVIDKIWDKARSNMKTIALPEGSERRNLLAAEIITREKLANVVCWQ